MLCWRTTFINKAIKFSPLLEQNYFWNSPVRYYASKVSTMQQKNSERRQFANINSCRSLQVGAIYFIPPLCSILANFGSPKWVDELARCRNNNQALPYFRKFRTGKRRDPRTAPHACSFREYRSVMQQWCQRPSFFLRFLSIEKSHHYFRHPLLYH